MSCFFCASGMALSKEMSCCSRGLRVLESTEEGADATERTRAIHAIPTQTKTAKTAIAQERFIAPPQRHKEYHDRKHCLEKTTMVSVDCFSGGLRKGE